MWLDQNVRISNELNKITRVGVMSLVDIADETIFRFRFGQYRHAVEKALKKEHQHQPTAVSQHFAVTGHA